MHTDEYEISVGREINHCRKLVKKLQDAILDREKRYGMTTESFLEKFRADLQEVSNPDYRKWHEDHRELQRWRQMLSDYEAAYRSLKEI